ncbi:hypothetical protein F5B22DRAFT_597720 [Xylaria bambusicola]|uniref:uncharacterized protein n=1 Tax=Xylaria bambusicola TaxID=326684 RepID=UPI002008A127|nr:uncharacterized protein F5B22DRAFT_597720 [Xylaria bambusicola]KAI0521121.1 hypothetical protein F5B22DRAFT_597720 [Xylaria bambusicola]
MYSRLLNSWRVNKVAPQLDTTMDDAVVARRRRVEARAVGRTPEEHAALERALARRRARLHNETQLPRPVQRHHLSPVENVNPRRLRSELLGTNGSQARVGDREDSPPAEMPEHLHEIDDSEIYTIFKMCHKPHPFIHGRSSFPHFDYAMFRAKVAAAKSSPALPALGVPPTRRWKPGYNPRKVRGAGWHKRGYRDLGNMWINVRDGSYGHTRGRDVYENQTLSQFAQFVFFDWESEFPEGWYCDMFFRKKSVTRLLVDLENLGLDMELVLVKDYFDGGETVYMKLYDQDGEEQSRVPFG